MNKELVTFNQVKQAYDAWLSIVSNPSVVDLKASDLAFKEFLKLKRKYDRWSDEPFNFKLVLTLTI